MTLDEIFEHGKEAAKFLFDQQGSLHPTWICETKNGQVFPICVDMPDHDKRDAFARALRISLRHNQVERYVFMTECWMKIICKEEPLPIGSLEYDPDRREAITITAEDIDGKMRSGTFFILRPEHSDPKLSPFEEWDNKPPAEGRFTRLLNTENLK